jgi:hypothetical protein
MKKFLLPGILAVLSLFLPSRSQADPLDIPYQIKFDTVAYGTTLVISTTNFPSPNATVNSLVASYEWCIEQANISNASATSFTMAWSTTTLSAATTDYQVTTAAGVPFDTNFHYRTPYCTPVGWPILTLKTSVVNSTMTVRGYLWKGWN